MKNQESILKKTPRDTKRRIRKISIKNALNTLIVHILCEKHDGEFLFKVNLISRLPNPVELSQEWVLTNLKYKEPFFIIYCLVSQERDRLKSLQGVKKR